MLLATTIYTHITTLRRQNYTAQTVIKPVASDACSCLGIRSPLDGGSACVRHLQKSSTRGDCIKGLYRVCEGLIRVIHQFFEACVKAPPRKLPSCNDPRYVIGNMFPLLSVYTPGSLYPIAHTSNKPRLVHPRT